MIYFELIIEIFNVNSIIRYQQANSEEYAAALCQDISIEKDKQINLWQ